MKFGSWHQQKRRAHCTGVTQVKLHNKHLLLIITSYTPCTGVMRVKHGLLYYKNLPLTIMLVFPVSTEVKTH